MEGALKTGAADGNRLYRYCFGDVEFDEARFELRVNGLPVEVENKPLLVLLALLRRPGEVVTRDELQGRAAVSHALSNTVSKLRKALGPVDGERIATVAKGGYRFDGDVVKIAVGRRSVSTLNLVPGQAIIGHSACRLERQLAETPDNEVWLGRREGSGESVVFKFSRHGESLAVLKRETTVNRLLKESLGERPDLVSLRSWNFDTAPFFVESDYCGENLEQWSSRPDGLKLLDLEQRLGIFLQIADAVGAAHGVGVLHKDLKPTNIFMRAVAGDYQIKVGDFGNSSMLEPERLDELGITRLGMTVSVHDPNDSVTGTPLYLAPEVVVGGPFTIKADIYSLGLLLWQIAIADCRRPIASGWEQEIHDAFLVEDIYAATAGDPARRLSSVLELTTRIRNRAVRAQERTAARAAAQRAAEAEKELDRSRARRPWLMAFTAALLVGLAFSIYEYHEEYAARRIAELEQAREASINAFLTDILKSADPAAPGGAAHTTVESALSHAEASLKREFPNDPATRGAIELTLGDAFSSLSDYDRALGFHREAYDLLRTGLGVHHPTTLTAAYQLAGNLDMLSRHAASKAILDDTDAAAGELLHEPSLLSLNAKSRRGGNYLMQMQAGPALEQFLQTESIRRALEPAEAAKWLVHVRSDIAWCDVRLDRNLEALTSLAVLMTPEYPLERLGVFEWAKLHLQYGIALSNLGRFDESQSVLQAAQQQIERQLGRQSYINALAYNYLAASYKAAGNWSAAANAAEREYEIWSASVGPEHQSTLAALTDKAVIGYLQSPGDVSFETLRHTQASVARVMGPHSPFTQYANFYLGQALLDRGDAATANEYIRDLDAADLASADLAPDWPSRLQGLKGRWLLATNHTAQGTRMLGGAVTTLLEHKAQPWVVQPLQAKLTDQFDR